MAFATAGNFETGVRMFKGRQRDFLGSQVGDRGRGRSDSEMTFEQRHLTTEYWMCAVLSAEFNCLARLRDRETGRQRLPVTSHLSKRLLANGP